MDGPYLPSYGEKIEEQHKQIDAYFPIHFGNEIVSPTRFTARDPFPKHHSRVPDTNPQGQNFPHLCDTVIVDPVHDIAYPPRILLYDRISIP